MKKEEVVIDRPSLGSRIFICIVFIAMMITLWHTFIELIEKLSSSQSIIIAIILCGITILLGYLVLCFLTCKLVAEKEA